MWAGYLYFGAAVAVVAVIAVLAVTVASLRRRLARAERRLSALERVARNKLYRERLEDERARNVRIINLLTLAYRDFSRAMREVVPDEVNDAADER